MVSEEVEKERRDKKRETEEMVKEMRWWFRRRRRWRRRFQARGRLSKMSFNSSSLNKLRSKVKEKPVTS